MSGDLEEIFNCILDGRVPSAWLKGMSFFFTFKFQLFTNNDLFLMHCLAYPSLKPLGAWSRDLIQRIDQLQLWATSLKPPVKFWLSGFTFPTGFLTAVLQVNNSECLKISIFYGNNFQKLILLMLFNTLQTTARKYGISIDSLVWEFSVSTIDSANILVPPKDGVYIQGLFLEGASWDKKNACLIEAAPMQLVTPMPVILFRPIEIKKKIQRGI